MDRIADILNSICREAFSDAGYDPAYGKAGVSNRPDLCEYQCNGAMALAKTAHKAPLIIAEEITERLKAYPQFSKVEAVRPGFINMDLDKAFLSSYLADMDRDERLGLPLPEEPETIIVDYGGANVAKPLHIGHLRSAIIGESVKRIGRAMGHHMIGDVHLGDWGLQMGLIIEELRDRGMEDFTLSDLEEIYPAASARSKEKDESGQLTPEAAAFRDRALEATAALQNGDPQCRKVWEHIMELSLADLRRNYDSLGVSFELWKGESDAQKYIPDMIADMEARGELEQWVSQRVSGVFEELKTALDSECDTMLKDTQGTIDAIKEDLLQNEMQRRKLLEDYDEHQNTLRQILEKLEPVSRKVGSVLKGEQEGEAYA